MSIKIKTISRRNPQNLDLPEKYYATAKNQGELTLNNLSKKIALMSTVSKTDVYAVLMALTEVIPDVLEEGKIVRLGTIGSFRVVVASNSEETAEEVDSHTVKQLKLRFTPNMELKKMVENFPVVKD